jgi:hypothetical protein
MNLTKHFEFRKLQPLNGRARSPNRRIGVTPAQALAMESIFNK